MKGGLIMRLKVKLGNVSDAVLFAAKCNEYDCDVDYLYDKRYVLDAKSLMAIIAAGLNTVREVEIHTDDTEILQKFLDSLSLWIVNE